MSKIEINGKIYYGFLFLISFILLLGITEATTLGTFKKNECVDLIQTCGNCTYSNITSVMYPNSSVALSNIQMQKSGTRYNRTFCNTSDTGIYIVTGFGDPNGDVVVWNYDFKITPNGEDSNVGTAILYIGIFIVILFFLALSIYSFITFDNLLNRVGMLGLSYLLLIAITFIAWNMSQDFLTSAPFLISIFRIFFFVLVIGFFPLVIGGFIYYFLKLWEIKEIQRLMDKGIPEDEAYRRTLRR